MPEDAPAFARSAPDGGHYNGQLYAAGWGELKIKVVSFTHGMSVYSAEDHTRTTRIVYPFKVELGDFSVTLTHTTHAMAEAFGKRMLDYVRKASDPDASVGAMAVLIPSRDFVQFGIPTRGVTHGDKVGAITYPMTIAFTAAVDPLSILQEEDLSHISNVTETNSMFYPAEVGEAAEFALYKGTTVPGGGPVKRGPS